MEFAGLNMLHTASQGGRGSLVHVGIARLKENAKLIMAGFVLLIVVLLNSAIGTKLVENTKAIFVEAAFSSMKLEQIHYAGLNRTQEVQLDQAMNLSQGTSMLTLNLEEIKTMVEAMPWVKTATVSRQFPDNLFIKIVERTPYAVWQINSELWLIDEDGVKITQDKIGNYSHLPFLVGQGASQSYAEIASAFKETPTLSGKITSLIRVGDRRWDVMFDTGARLRLPENSDKYTINSAWLRFEQMNRDHDLLSREVAVYDMRFSDRMIVTLTERGERAPLAMDEEV